MTKNKIEVLIKSALSDLYSDDFHLIKYDLSERCIAHRLAIHLAKFFLDYDVDCEYNMITDSDPRPKYIKALKAKLKKIGYLNATEKKGNDTINDTIADKFVNPDIVVHKRGKKEHNLCVIELKKSTNKDSKAVTYDLYKLQLYISPENTLRYKYGVFVKINTNNDYNANNSENWKLDFVG